MRGRTLRSEPAGDVGAAAVELALVVFPLLMMLLGIVEFGRAYSTQLQMQHAAREVAREIALSYDDPGPVDLGALADDTLDDLLGGLASAPDFTTTIIECSLSTPVDDAEVTLEKPLSLAIPLVDGTTLGSITLRARAEMPCEG